MTQASSRNCGPAATSTGSLKVERGDEALGQGPGADDDADERDNADGGAHRVWVVRHQIGAGERHAQGGEPRLGPRTVRLPDTPARTRLRPGPSSSS